MIKYRPLRIIKDFPVLESFMLTHFKWQVVLPTAYHFTDTWLPHAMLSYSCCEGPKVSQPTTTPETEVADSNSNNMGSGNNSGGSASADKIDEIRFKEHVKCVMMMVLKAGLLQSIGLSSVG